MNTFITTRGAARFVAIAVLSFSAATQAQVLGNGGLTGNLGGGLSGTSHGMNGSLTGGIGGSGELGTSAFDRTRQLGDRTATRTRSKLGETRGVVDEKADAAKATGLRAQRTARNKGRSAIDSASRVGESSASIAGGAASHVDAGRNAAADASAFGSGEFKPTAITEPSAGNLSIAGATDAKDATQPASPNIPTESLGTPNPSSSLANGSPRRTPKANAEGGADLDANAEGASAKSLRAGKQPRVDASANADGNARVSRR